MMQYTQVIIGIQQIADMEIHDRCVDFAAISILFEVFRHGNTVLLQTCEHSIVRNRTGIHVAQRRELAAHFIEQLLTAAQISSFLPPRGNTHGMMKKRDRLFFENTQFIVQLRHFVAQRRKIRVAVRDHTRLQKREKLLLQLVHHIQDFLAVVIRPDHDIDHERNRQTDHRICEAMKAVDHGVSARIQTDIREHNARERNGKIQPQRNTECDDTERADCHPQKELRPPRQPEYKSACDQVSEKSTGNLRQTFLQ